MKPKLPSQSHDITNMQFTFNNQFLVLALPPSCDTILFDRFNELKNTYVCEYFCSGYRQFLKFFIPTSGQRKHIYSILNTLAGKDAVYVPRIRKQPTYFN